MEAAIHVYELESEEYYFPLIERDWRGIFCTLTNVECSLANGRFVSMALS